MPRDGSSPKARSRGADAATLRGPAAAPKVCLPVAVKVAPMNLSHEMRQIKSRRNRFADREATGRSIQSFEQPASWAKRRAGGFVFLWIAPVLHPRQNRVFDGSFRPWLCRAPLDVAGKSAPDCYARAGFAPGPKCSRRIPHLLSWTEYAFRRRRAGQAHARTKRQRGALGNMEIRPRAD